VIAALLVLVFSCLGLGLLTFSLISRQLTANRNLGLRLGYACENGLKLGLDPILESRQDGVFPMRMTTGDYAALLEDGRSGGTGAAESLLGETASGASTGSLADMEWELEARTELRDWEEGETMFISRFSICLLAEGALRGFRPRQRASVLLSLKIMAGRVPLAALTVLLGSDPGEGGVSGFLDENRIEITQGDSVSSAPVTAAGEDLLPQDGARLLSKALKIREFSPGELPAAALRLALGLEVSDEPVPDGVYLIEDDLGLGGIFVQGDVEEMVLAVCGDDQVISFLTETGRWVVRFNPENPETRFITPVETRAYDLIPLGIVYVTGSIRSLGGGILEETGEAVLVTDDEVPCLRQGVRLSIICPEEIVLSSHLVREGVDWDSAVPYASGSETQLEIFAAAAGHDGSEGSGTIRIAEDAPEDLKVAASLTAAGEGLVSPGEGRSLDLLGSLHVSEYQDQGGSIRLTAEPDIPDSILLGSNGPVTPVPLLQPLVFAVTEWRDRLE
jgi:hypothetical protein